MPPRRHRRLRRAALVALVLLALLWFENDTLRTDTVVLSMPRLSAAFDGLRVVQLSDLHGHCFGRAHSRLLRAVRRAAPDLIALTGDLADAKTDLAALAPLLRGLCALAPTYYVTGNHEWTLSRAERTQLFQLLARCGVQRLSNAAVPLTRSGQTLLLAGVDDPNGPADQMSPAQLITTLRAQDADACILLLAHRNDRLDDWAALELDAVLCGHAHGGVVRLPGLGGLFGPSGQLLPDYDAGVFRAGRTLMYVSPGLGSVRGLPLRLLNRPTVSVVVLRCTKP